MVVISILVAFWCAAVVKLCKVEDDISCIHKNLVFLVLLEAR